MQHLVTGLEGGTLRYHPYLVLTHRIIEGRYTAGHISCRKGDSRQILLKGRQSDERHVRSACLKGA